ncbi:MAG: DUF2239 family protein [Acidobacteria bacterium]|nr:DUF2239 family protein [Acidobacteriota bacterium]
METYTIFLDDLCVARGALDVILAELKRQFDVDPGRVFLVFDDRTGRQVDFDLRGTLDEVLARAGAGKPGRGRPKLGVTAREVTLLPIHWEWLEEQPAGVSAALRRLVEEARKREPEEQRRKRRAMAAGRFLTAVGGNLPGFEEAMRALYQGNDIGLRELASGWPAGIAGHVVRLWEGETCE